MVDRPRLTPEQVAGRSFPNSFRGFDQGEVRAFLGAVADELRVTARAGELAAADLLAEAELRAATLVAEAEGEARRIHDTLEAERQRAFTEGAARADELIAAAEQVRAGAESAGRVEAERLVVEARAVRERILGDLARRRATLREQVEQLHAARERLLAGLAELRAQVDEAVGDLRSSLPEAKMAADAAARRVASEVLPTAQELEREIAAFRAAGLELTVGEAAEDDSALGSAPEAEPPPGEAVAATMSGPAAPAVPAESQGAEPSAESALEAPPTPAESPAGTAPAPAESSESPASTAPAAEPPAGTAPAPTEPAVASTANGAQVTEEPRSPAPPSPPAPTPAPPPVVEEQPERRSATVRVFRTRRDPTPAFGVHEPELHAVDPAAPFEEVRLVSAGEVEGEPVGAAEVGAAEVGAAEVGAAEVGAAEVGAAEVGAAEVGAAEVGAGAGVVAHDPPPPEAIDELFARLKAGRAERTAAAEAALTARLVAAASAPEAAGPAVVEPPAPTRADSTAGPDSGPSPASADAAELARRDAAIGGAREALSKRLKRQLADEQNEVLHGLRRGEIRVFELDDADDHAAAWTLAAGHELAVVANVGAGFEGDGEPPRLLSVSDVAEVAEAFADAFARPLRLKVLEAIDASDGDSEVAADAVRSVYRDRRSRRLDDAVDDAVLGAFSTGLLAAAPAGTAFRWVVDDGELACPDCDDNGLAGAVVAGSPFPTGHVAPPAHPGCRCHLVRTRHQ